MDKEIIELIKTVAGSTENLIIWYLVIDFAKSVVGAVGFIGCFYMFGRGVRAVNEYVDESF